jgi:hypothetical protein
MWLCGEFLGDTEMTFNGSDAFKCQVDLFCKLGGAVLRQHSGSP